MEIYLADICHPDYFGGSPSTVFAVPVHPKMRYGELLNGLLKEINQTELEDDNYKLAEKCAKAAFKGQDMRKSIPGLQDIDPEGDTIFAYFILENSKQ